MRKVYFRFSILEFTGMLLLVLNLSCSKLDNYNAPDAGIKGKVIDNVSNKPLQSVQPNGFQIRLIEVNLKYENPIPIDFWGKADGTYRNTKLFADKYRVIPFNGAFFEPDTQVVNIHGLATVNFTVTPFLELTNVSVTPIEKGAIVRYQIIKPKKSNQKIISSESLASRYPNVGHSVFESEVVNNLSSITDDIIESMQFSDTLSGLKTGKVYYVRVAASTNNSNNRYNYSKIFKINVK